MTLVLILENEQVMVHERSLLSTRTRLRIWVMVMPAVEKKRSTVCLVTCYCCGPSFAGSMRQECRTNNYAYGIQRFEIRDSGQLRLA